MEKKAVSPAKTHPTSTTQPSPARQMQTVADRRCEDYSRLDQSHQSSKRARREGLRKSSIHDSIRSAGHAAQQPRHAGSRCTTGEFASCFLHASHLQSIHSLFPRHPAKHQSVYMIRNGPGRGTPPPGHHHGFFLSQSFCFFLLRLRVHLQKTGVEDGRIQLPASQLGTKRVTVGSLAL